MRSIDLANNKMQSPLHIAAFKLHREAVALMLQHGKENTDINNSANNSTNVAAFKLQSEAVALMLQHGTNSEKYQKKGFFLV
jgi:ankyrin repeat protein